MVLTIIIATYNSAGVIARCLESIRAQDKSGYALELVIMDGGSSDGTQSIIRRYSDVVTCFESKLDRGIAHAWNKGVVESCGDWLLFLGADDYLWSRSALQEMVPHLNGAGGYEVVYGDVIGIGRDGQKVGLLSGKWSRKKFTRFGIYFSHQGVFHSRQLFSNYGLFDEEFRYGPDYELLLRHLIDHDALYCQGVVVSAMQMGGLSNSPENAYIALGDFSKARRKMKVLGNAPFYYRARLGAFVKLLLARARNCLSAK